jgi:predicted ATP-binding protein involved in virulence
MKRYALILIDEIDAHMHPHWQHVLIGTLKNLFPSAQFVASSHSALVVSGLSRDEVLVFSRDDGDARKVKAAHPPGDLKGWRVDQILTSAAFGLAGARDPETLRDLER